MTVVDEGMDRQELDRRDAKVADMVDDGRLAQAAIGAAQLLANAGMELGVAADMELIDDRALPGRPWDAVLPPGKGRIDDATTRHERRTVSYVERGVVPRLHLVAEHRRIPFEVSHDRFRIRIQQELVRVEPVPVLRLIGSVNAIAIDRPRSGVRKKTVPHLVRELRQFDALDLAFALI